MAKRYSLDIDGVVADYFTGRSEAAKEIGIPMLTQPVGLLPNELDAVMQERLAKINKAMKEHISADLERFFGGLACIATPDDHAAIQRAAAAGYELFWVSARSFFGGHNVAATTETLSQITLDWLVKNNLPADAQHVILTADKAAAIKTIGIQFHLDDNVPHVTSVALHSSAAVALLRQPWNQRFLVTHPTEPDADYFTSAGAYGVEEVDSIAEYITLMMGR